VIAAPEITEADIQRACRDLRQNNLPDLRLSVVADQSGAGRFTGLHLKEKAA
jgi:hypothetical protein